jgi:hypothetical protein
MINKEIEKQLDEYFENRSKEEILNELKEKGTISFKEVNPTGPYRLGFEIELETTYEYNNKFGNDKQCICGHPYYRHFDSYENMDPIGCKYCDCVDFELEEEISK